MTTLNPIDNRILAIAGYHEPLAHYRRRGGWFADDEQHHARFYTEEMVEKIAALGATTVVCPGYKGLGLQYERAEMDRLKPLRKLVERAGIEFGAYLQCGSFFAETFYDENPQAREWTALDYWGKPQVYSEYYRCYWRHRPCLTHREFSEYVARAAQVLANEYGVTYFNADNNAQLPCYTEHFRKAFHQFLKEKYQTDTTEGLATFVRRYGHPKVDNIVLPHGSARRPLESMHALPDPGLQDWVEFRCRLVARNCEIITRAVKEANPAARLCYNLSYDYGEFHQLVWATEPEFVAPHADLIFSEDGNQARVTTDGRLISQVHTCKHVRALGRRVELYPGHHDVRLWMMEMAIHNQSCFGYLYANDFDIPKDDPRPSMIRFVRRHEDVFTNNETVADIAVLRSRHSSTINWLEATEGRLLAEQALFQDGFQWDTVLESTLDQLSRYRLLVLPETISVPDACVKQIAEYVRQGGRLLAIGNAMSCNEWGCRRTRSTAMQLFGESDAGYGSTSGAGFATAIVAAWLGLDKESARRVFAFPRLQHPRPHVWDPDETRAPVLNYDHHALPVNNADFIACVREMLPNPVVDAGRDPFVIPTLLRSRQDRRISLHILNYRPERRVESLTVRLRMSGLNTAWNIQFNSSKPGPIAVTREGDSISFTLPPFELYSGVLF